MIYLFYGSDTEKAYRKYSDLLEKMAEKQPTASRFDFSPENFEPSVWREVSIGQTLFYKNYLVGVRHLLVDKNWGEAVIADLPKLAESNNLFVFLDGELPAPILKKIEKLATKIIICEKKAGRVETGTNPFALADSLASRDRQKLWLNYQEVLAGGGAPEEVFGKLWWQLKMLLLAKQEKSVPKDIKPFVWQKARAGAVNYNLEDLRALAANLFSVYHQNFIGSDDFALALERFILSV